jgi:hypothetical protein
LPNKNPSEEEFAFGLNQKLDTKKQKPIQPMKRKIKKSSIIIFTAAAAGLFLSSCAEMEATNTKSLLSAAGFRVRTPQTPKQQEIYAALPPYRVERATINGKVFYVFKDERDGVAYVGREPEYQRYRQLCIQQQIAQDYYMAAQMNSYYARGWYGAWGPRGVWW